MIFAFPTLRSLQPRIAPLKCLPVTPLFATLTTIPQIPENSTTLSSVFATLTSRVKHKFFVCHSYKKHPGWGSPVVIFFAQTSVFALLRHSTSESSAAKDPRESKDLAVLQVTSCKSPLEAPVLSLPPVTSHQSQVTKSCRIRTCTKRTRNSFRFRTSKTQDLKPFRIRTYEKPLRGVPLLLSLLAFAPSAIIIGLALPPGSTTFWPVRTLRTHDAA